MVVVGVMVTMIMTADFKVAAAGSASAFLAHISLFLSWRFRFPVRFAIHRSPCDIGDIH